jgi:ABC-2 type transport system permease protein
VARSVLAGYASEVEAVRLSVATAILAAGDVPDADAMSALGEQALAAVAPVALVDRRTDDLRVSYATYYAAAMAILFVFFAAQFGVASLHAEHRAGTLRRMLAAPVPWWAILAGKIVVSLVLALLSLSIIIVGTAVLLGATWGDPLALAALVGAAALAGTGIALLAVAFTRNEEQAGSAVAIVAMTLAVVGGAFFPVSQGPELLSQLSLISPHAWFLDGVSDVATGGDIGSAAVPVLALAGVGIVCGGLGLLRGKRLVLR